MYTWKGNKWESLTIKIFITLLISILFFPSHVKAFEKIEKKAPKVLVIFSTANNEIDRHQRMFDMLIGHFTDDITFKSSSKIEKKDFDGITHLFYYGQKKQSLPNNLVNMIDNYKGIIVAIGYNVDQIKSFSSFVGFIPKEVNIDKIYFSDNPNKNLSFKSINILNVYLVNTRNSNMLLVGKRGSYEYPLFIKQDKKYYFASPYMTPSFSIAFGDMLNEVFQRKCNIKNLAYIRLEDIHPFSDPNQLMNIAIMLKEKNIPYMMAVIPVYTNPDNGKKYHFSDFPKLLKVLKYMQNNGGSIILHGYTHQFRLSETGEGFEFWDVKYNTPIYHSQDEKVIIKGRRDFENDEDYSRYIRGKKEFEKKYIEKKIYKGVQELANYGLYPLAFEAPHYAMSQNGYKVISNHFSTYVGNIQLSDEDWRISATSPYITKPNFLNGMTLLPETIGYVNIENNYTIEKMMESVHKYRLARGGIIGGFYHPYLGKELFIALIENMESIPNISWVDLKEMENRVKVENVEIKTKNGQLTTKINYEGLFFTSIDYLIYHIRVVIKNVFWVMAGIGTMAALIFSYNICRFVRKPAIKYKWEMAKQDGKTQEKTRQDKTY